MENRLQIPERSSINMSVETVNHIWMIGWYWLTDTETCSLVLSNIQNQFSEFQYGGPERSNALQLKEEKTTSAHKRHPHGTQRRCFWGDRSDELMVNG